MKLIIHIGLHKTGTSSLQAFCEFHREALAKANLLYPKTAMGELLVKSSDSAAAGHRRFEEVLISPKSESAQRMLDKLVAEAQEAECDTVLLSSETFSATRLKISRHLGDVLAERFDEVRVLVYLRRQDAWADSFYREVLCWPRKREKRNYNDFCATFLADWLDYEARLAVWSKHFGDDAMIVQSYDDRAHKDIVTDVFSAIGFEPPVLENPPSNNPSLPGNLVPFMREINGLHLDKVEKSVVTRDLYDRLANSDLEIEAERLPAPYLEQQREAFKAGNRRVAERYGLSDAPILTYETTPDSWTGTRKERSLPAEVLDEMMTRARTTGGREAAREVNAGTWGLSVLCNEDPVQTASFLDYHLELGAAKIIVYLDNPNDEVQSLLVDERIVYVQCDPAFWKGLLGRMPNNNAEKLSEVHKLGLERLRGEFGLDWAINVDADELLWVKPGTTMQEVLADMSQYCNQVVIYPREAVFIEDSDSAVFGARYFKVRRSGEEHAVNRMNKTLVKRLAKEVIFGAARVLPMTSKPVRFALERVLPKLGIQTRRLSQQDLFEFALWNGRDERLYQEAMPRTYQLLRTGFLGHRQGRVATAKGVKLDEVKSHRHESSKTIIKMNGSNGRIYVLHYDAVAYDAWHLKWHRRVYGDAKVHAIGEARKQQQDMFQEAFEAGTTEQLFRDMFYIPKPMVRAFERARLIAKMDVPHITEITAKWRAQRDAQKTEG